MSTRQGDRLDLAFGNAALSRIPRSLAPKIRHVSVEGTPTDDQLRRIGDLIGRRRDIRVIISLMRRGGSLDFLKWFPSVRRISISVWRTKSLDGLEHLPSDLLELDLSCVLLPKGDVSPLARLRHLRVLNVEGPQRIAQVLPGLTTLRALWLRSITMPNLRCLESLKDLRWLWVGLGGTKSLDGIGTLPSLQYLELWRILGLSDLEPLAGSDSIRELYLQSLPRVLSLAPLNRMRTLERLTLHSMKGIARLRELIGCRRLTELVLMEARHMRPETVVDLVRHPSLTRAMFDLGRRGPSDAASALLPLPAAQPSRYRSTAFFESLYEDA